MGNQGHGLVVVRGRAFDPAGIHRLGQAPNHRQGLGVGGVRGRRHPGPAGKQARQTRLHPGLRRAGHRMAGHKAGPLAPAIQHPPLDRAHVGDHRPWRNGRQQLGARIEQAIEGQGQHHQGAIGQHGRIGAHLVRQAALAGPLGGGLPVHQGLDPQALGPQIKGQGAANQAQAHHPDRPLTPRHGHGRPPAWVTAQPLGWSWLNPLVIAVPVGRL